MSDFSLKNLLKDLKILKKDAKSITIGVDEKLSKYHKRKDRKFRRMISKPVDLGDTLSVEGMRTSRAFSIGCINQLVENYWKNHVESHFERDIKELEVMEKFYKKHFSKRFADKPDTFGHHISFDNSDLKVSEIKMQDLINDDEETRSLIEVDKDGAATLKKDGILYWKNGKISAKNA